MKISTITVCFNSDATIAYTIRSFLKQSYSNKEMLIIDGGSADRTIEIIRSFDSKLIRLISEPDRGIYDAMNKGLKNYTGDAVGFLNADDAFHDDSSLQRIAHALGSADAVYGDLVMISDHERRQVVRKWRAGEFTPGAFRKGWMPPHPTFYIRRNLARQTGLFDLGFANWGDYDFILRAMELNHPRVNYIPHTLVDFMVGGVSTTGICSVIRGNIECLRSRRRHLGSPVVDAAFFTKPLRKMFQRFSR